MIQAAQPEPFTTKRQDQFRNYINSTEQESVERTYKINHEKQTVAFVREKRKQYLSLQKAKMTIWQALELRNSSVTRLTRCFQIAHLVQTAEAARKLYPGEEYDWLHLTALLHDAGKVLAHPNFAGEPHWAVVGDTFPVGCKFSDKIVFSKYFDGNVDAHNEAYNTQLGMYSEHCGLDEVMMSWGHDEYMYQVCVQNNCNIPLEGLYIIRYHSFYPQHRDGQYDHLLNDQDRRMMRWVKDFNQFDLYSKAHDLPDLDQVKPYYDALIRKYFPEQLLRW